MNTRAPSIVGEFLAAPEILAAARAASAAGFGELDAYTPFHVEDLAEAIGLRRTGVAPITLIGALTGAALGYGLQAYSAIFDYPLNVGGRPLHSWPAFVPITFELTILCAALGTALGMLILNRLPQPHHPIFELPHFAERNDTRFYLAIHAPEDVEKARALLRAHRATEIWELPA